MSVIKQISVFNGSDWSTGDIGADASNIDISSAILGSSTNVQSALTTIGNKIGTTAIPSGLGTTITGAINTLNGNISNLIYIQDYVVPQLTITSGTPGTRGAQVYFDVPVSGYLPLLVRLTQVSDSILANVVPFFGSPALPNTVYVNAYRASGSAGTITANIRVVYIKN